MDWIVLNTLLQNAGLDPERFQVVRPSPGDVQVKWLSTPTAAETAVVADVVANYDTLAAAYRPRVTSLTPYQAREQMAAMGVLDQVEAAIAAAGTSAVRKWEYATVILRDDALFLSIKAICGFTDEQEETFFSEGSLL